MTWYAKTALTLSAIGAINWGLDKLGWNVVDALVGSWSAGLATVLYYVIGLSGIYALVKAVK